MTTLLLILSFIAFAIVQSIFINGVHISMDGKEKLDKNGNWIAVGDILYPIARQLRMGKRVRSVLDMKSAKNALLNAAQKSTKKYPVIEVSGFGNIGYIPIYVNNDNSLLISCLQDIFINFNIKYAHANEFSFNIPLKEFMGAYVLYTEDTEYRYGSFVRKSIGGSCIKCMASFYGIITFVPAFICQFGFKVEMIPLLIADIFILVFLNSFFYKQ